MSTANDEDDDGEEGADGAVRAGPTTGSSSRPPSPLVDDRRFRPRAIGDDDDVDDERGRERERARGARGVDDVAIPFLTLSPSIFASPYISYRAPWPSLTPVTRRALIVPSAGESPCPWEYGWPSRA